MSELSEDDGKSSQDTTGESSKGQSDDDFFDSLLSDLKSKDRRSPDSGGRKKRTESVGNSADDEDFFAALEAELGSSGDTSKPNGASDVADDFFAQLETELVPPPSSIGAVREPYSESSSSRPPRSPQKRTTPEKTPSLTTDEDDVFAGLSSKESFSPSNEVQQSDNRGDDNDFFAALEADLVDDDPSKSTELDGVFAGLDNKERESSQVSFWNDFDSKVPEKEDKPPEVKTTRNDNPRTKGTTRIDEPSSTKIASSAASSSFAVDDLKKHTVPVLKEMLRERGLKVSGKKAELVDRLMQKS